MDDEADSDQYEALRQIYLGEVGGHPANSYAAAIQEVLGVESADINLQHSKSRWRIGVQGRVEVRASEATRVDGPVTCGISGDQNPGTEYTADLLKVTDDPFEWEVSGKASFVAPFSYAGGD